MKNTSISKTSYMMPVFSSCYDWGEGLLKTTYDIDGLFVELESLESIKDRISYIRLPKVNHVSIKKHFNVQKACGNGWMHASPTFWMEKHIRLLYCTDHRWLFSQHLCGPTVQPITHQHCMHGLHSPQPSCELHKQGQGLFYYGAKGSKPGGR